MRRRPPRSTRTDTLSPTRRSSDLCANIATRATAWSAPKCAAPSAKATSAMSSPTVLDPTACAIASTARRLRSEEHTSELQSLMRISYAVFCLKKQEREIARQSVTDSVTMYTVHLYVHTLYL